MKKILAFLLLLPLFSINSAYSKPQIYDYDASHTSILFFISHSGFSKMVGEFNDYEGFFRFDQNSPEESSVTITIDPVGVDTGHDGLNKKLQNEKFFNSSVHESIKFVSTKVEKISDNSGKLTGNLTMLGVTKPLTFDVTFNKEGEFFGQMRAGFSLKAKLKRSDFGMVEYLPTVGDEIDILVEAEGVRRDLE